MQTNSLIPMGKAAREASYVLASRSTGQKNAFLLDLADALEKRCDAILAANAKDLTAAKENGMTDALLDRLALTPERIAGIAASVRDVAALKDPVGDVLSGRTLENGMSLIRKRVPLGVVAVIYEARPNVTVDVAALCLKTGNAVILRGGKETTESNAFLVQIIQDTLAAHNLPATTVQLISNPDRKLVTELMHLDAYVDMLIPRGGAGLQRRCQEESRIPVILGGIGVCHILVDASACQTKALAVLENAKVQRPSVCNSVETALVHEDIAAEFLPKLAAHLGALGVTLHVTDTAKKYLSTALAVTEEELSQEWLSLDLNVHVVKNLDDAVNHIRRYGSAHSDAILTESMENAAYFVNAVDSSAVYVNASTRFTDGGEFGLGAEVAVSTQKMHARGPMGLDALTTYKWIAQGNYTTR